MRGDHTNVLMYSHDTFGLGHLRRSRAIAHALVERSKQLNVLIVSGSSIAGAFDFRARVDFIKVPSVIKLYNGNYTSLAEHIDLGDTLHMRRAIIQSAAEIFRPDVFIVDKEPLGLKGELEPTLAYLKMCGCRLVLGLREVLDGPELIRAEWGKTNAMNRVEELYDQIWVYGCASFWDPFCGLDVPPRVRSRMRYMGYLRRTESQTPSLAAEQLPPAYVLVTVGGGGDGAALMHQVLAAREIDPDYPLPIVLILGPFMNGDERQEIHARASFLKDITVIDFDNRIETLMADAKAMVSMGGYNTFCEILSFDKPALLVPRTFPRREQAVRAERAAEMGLVDLLDADQAADPRRMAASLRALLNRKRPSQGGRRIDLNGLERISSTLEGLTAGSTERRLEPISA